MKIFYPFMPNPTSDYIHIDFNGLDNDLACIRIFDEMGREIYYSGDLENKTGFTIDVRSLAAGIYLLQATDTGGFPYSSKFVKL